MKTVLRLDPPYLMSQGERGGGSFAKVEISRPPFLERVFSVTFLWFPQNGSSSIELTVATSLS